MELPNTCAIFSDSGNSNGNNDDITFFRTAFVMEDGVEQEVDCYPTGQQEISNDAAAHELAHLLGLDHPNCPPPTGTPIIQARGSSSLSEFYDTTRRVSSADCAFADAVSGTPQESENECPQGDPDCDPEWSPFSPIVLDLYADGYLFSGLDDLVSFDIDADGTGEFIGWTASGRSRVDPFLVFDRNGNGYIDDGTELFGNATPLADGTVAAHGFEALVELDRLEHGGNFNGAIDPGDAIYERLGLWFDLDHDGRSDPGEVVSLRHRDVVRIGTNFVTDPYIDEHGNLLRFFGRAWRRGPGGRLLPFGTVDVFFVGLEP